MGRGRVQLKRIENKISRQVTFSKRRNGLMKKANEISVLCEADVALIIFSTKGKLYEFSTDSRMDALLERYDRCSPEQQLVPNDPHHQENWCLEYPKLKSRIDILQRSLRNYAGEELDPMSLRELQLLEQQMDTALKRIRSRNGQLYQESVSHLQKKEKSLHEQNNILAKQLKENEKTLADRQQWEQQNLSQNSSVFIPIAPPPPPPLPPHSFFSLPPLTIGRGNLQTRQFMNENEGMMVQAQPNTTQMPSWMFPHHFNE